MPTKIRELAWMAGIIDGEGCIGIHNRGKNRYVLAIQISNTEPELLSPFKNLFGGYLGPDKASRPNCKPVTKWIATGRVAAHVVKILRPYLRSGKKKAAATLGLRFQAQKRYGVRGNHEYLEAQRALQIRMKRINKRGR